MGLLSWIGGILGFMTFGPLGAVAGFVFGYLMEGGSNSSGPQYTEGRSYDFDDSSDGINYGQRNSFLFSLMVLAAHIIQADGKIMHSEMEFVRIFLRTNFGDSAAQQGNDILLKLFELRKQQDRESPYKWRDTISQCCAQIAANTTRSERLQMLNLLVLIAQADGNTPTTEINALYEVAQMMGLSVDEVKEACDSLHEVNPMMGHRGCRLAVTYPEIAEMQTRAVMEAAIEVEDVEGFSIEPEIMIPLVGDVKEFKYVKETVIKTAEHVKKERNSDIVYHIGTMIEIPRAALTAGEIAKEADFFSFGTNDLTQMTFGFSRDDAGKFLPAYYKAKIYESDPFSKLDQTGVGQLIEMAATKGREANPDIKLGICGEHGGDPSSVFFCHKVGLSYVSCSPFRVPIARLAAAQAALEELGVTG